MKRRKRNGENKMAKTSVTVKCVGFGGALELNLLTPGSTWVMSNEVGVSLQAWQFGPPSESKFRRLEMNGSRMYFEWNWGDGNHWEFTCAIESPQNEVSIRSSKNGSVIGSGSLVIASPVGSISHNNESSPLTFNLRLV
jgi:hypothetical protein